MEERDVITCDAITKVCHVWCPWCQWTWHTRTEQKLTVAPWRYWILWD